MSREREALLLQETERLRSLVEMLLISQRQLKAVMDAIDEFLRADTEAAASFKAALLAIREGRYGE